MDVVFGWLFISTFLSKVIQIESSLEITVGHFSLLRGHRQLRKCAVKALQQHVYVGAQISDQTGVCEGLSHSWSRNQTVESGYGYAKNVHVRINYNQPLEILTDGTFLSIPGVVNTEARLNIHITWAKLTSPGTLFIAVKDTNDARLSFSCQLVCTVNEFDKYGQTVASGDFDVPQQFRTLNRWKISFVAQMNTLYVLVDDEVVNTLKLTTMSFNCLRHLTLNTNRGKDSPTPKPRIQSFEVAEA